MLFNFSSPEYLSHHKTRKNRVSPVSRAGPAHMNSPLKVNLFHKPAIYAYISISNELFVFSICMEFLNDNLKYSQKAKLHPLSF